MTVVTDIRRKTPLNPFALHRDKKGSSVREVHFSGKSISSLSRTVLKRHGKCYVFAIANVKTEHGSGIAYQQIE